MIPRSRPPAWPCCSVSPSSWRRAPPTGVQSAPPQRALGRRRAHRAAGRRLPDGPARAAGRRRDPDVTHRHAPRATSSSASRPTCRRSRPATSSRWRSAASTTASSSTGRPASFRAATAFVDPGRRPALDGTGGPGYTITDEPVTDDYGRGTVAMARTPQPNSVGSQFFIVLDDSGRTSPRRRQHVPDHRRGDRRHGNGRCDRRGADSGAELPTEPIRGHGPTSPSPTPDHDPPYEGARP